MIKEVNDVIQHAVLASHDGEIKSIAIIMIANGDPEVHMAVSSDDAFAMNAAADMFKGEMIKLLSIRAQNRKPRQ